MGLQDAASPQATCSTSSDSSSARLDVTDMSGLFVMYGTACIVVCIVHLAQMYRELAEPTVATLRTSRANLEDHVAKNHAQHDARLKELEDALRSQGIWGNSNDHTVWGNSTDENVFSLPHDNRVLTSYGNLKINTNPMTSPGPQNVVRPSL